MQIAMEDDSELTDEDSGFDIDDILGEDGDGDSDGGNKKAVLDVDLRVGDDPDAGDGIVERRHVTFQKRYGDIELLEYDDCHKITDCVIVDGLPSSKFLTAVVVAGYLADQLHLPMIAEIRSRKFPPMCIVEKSCPLSAMRIVGNANVVVLMSEFKVSDPELAEDVVDAVLDFALRHRAKHVYTVEGIPKEMFEAELKGRKERAEQRAKDAETAKAEAALKAQEDHNVPTPVPAAAGDGGEGAEASGEGAGKAAEARPAEGAATPASHYPDPVGEGEEEAAAGGAAAGKGTGTGKGKDRAKGADAEKDKSKAKARRDKAEGKAAGGKAGGKHGSSSRKGAGGGAGGAGGSGASKRITKREKKAAQRKRDERLFDHLMFLTTDRAIADKLEGERHFPFRNGVVEGITGRFLGNIHTTTLHTSCLLAPCHPTLPDALSAVCVVKVLDGLIPEVRVDLGPLREKAIKLERQIGDLKSMITSQMAGAGGGRRGGAGAAPASMYM